MPIYDLSFFEGTFTNIRSGYFMEKFDIVITWVDNNDPVWRAEKNKYSGEENKDDRDRRYRDWKLLKYWFRGIEKFAPWVDHIFFVTYGHLPAFLNTEHPKLRIVNHRDFIPGKYLPTFSSRTIELNLHRIPGLSENFVYFNDDMFLLKPTKDTDFFKKGLPRDIAILHADYIKGEDDDGNPISPEYYYATLIYNIVLINRHFNKKKTMLKHLSKWFNPKYGMKVFHNFLLFPIKKFSGLRSQHVPYSLKKSTFEEVWDKEESVLDKSCSHKFREPIDVSSRLFSYWQVAKGEFSPRSYKSGYIYAIRNNEEDNRKVYAEIANRKYQMICLNDHYSGDDFEGVKKRLQQAFEKVFPEKSSYEK